MKKFKRTHYCGRISEKEIDKEVTVMGWVQNIRDMGGIIFLDFRDRTGILQVVFDYNNFSDEEYAEIEKIRSEYVVAATGKIRERDEETYNDKIPTGTVELKVEKFEVLSKSKPLPFPIEDNVDVKESVRLKYRYLDLRKPRMFENLMLRHKTITAIRDYLNKREFIEVETPVLTKSTPEGARDYLVPSRVHQGEFYALPQSPQLFKQLLMVSGFDKYYQVAKCFRDEDLRADRQPEFTQLDMELSFVDQEDILVELEALFKYIFKNVLGIEIKEKWPRITYRDAMARYGSDKPDLRFGMEIVDVSDIVKNSTFKVFTGAIKNGGIVRSINIKGGNNFTRTEIEELTEKAIGYGAKGMAWIGINSDGSLRTILDKYFTEDLMRELFERMDAKPDDLIIFCADSEKVVVKTLGALRLDIGDKLGLRNKDDYKFLFVTEFPLFEYSEEEGRYVAMHHPFTMPNEDDLSLIDKSPEKMRAQSYDVVLNGIELGSGSIRIHRSDIQSKMFELLGFDEKRIEDRFGFLVHAFQYGAPPHGGFAFGLDRLVMLMAQEDSIREVIAFPKNSEAEDLMSEAPNSVDDKQLEELGIEVVDEYGVSKSVKSENTKTGFEFKLDFLGELSKLNIEKEYRSLYEERIDDLVLETEELRKLDLADYKPTVNIHPINNSFRKDEVRTDFTRDELLDSGKQYDGYILVPRVIEE